MTAPSFNTYEIITSWDCNLKCTYCYEKNTNKEQPLIPVQDIVSFIEKTRSKQEPLYLQFMGGEPLLQSERIVSIIHSIENIPEPKHYSLTTNLTVGTREQINTLAKHGLHFLVSLDGLQSSNDLHRGTGSFSKTMQGLAYLITKRIPTEIRMTITPKTIASFKENFLFINSLGLAFNWILSTEQDYTSEECEKFVKDLHTLYVAPHNDKTIEIFLKRATAPGYCIDPKKTVCITPNGQLLNCSGTYENPQGSIYSIPNSYDIISKDFFANTRDSKECQDCATYVYCLGGCAGAKSSAKQKEVFCKTQKLMHVFVAEKKLIEVNRNNYGLQ